MAVSIKKIERYAPENILLKKLSNISAITTVIMVERYSFLASEEKGWRISHQICFLKTITTANSVARCKNTEKPIKLSDILKILLNKTKCPLEETGKNSVAPWIIPKIIASITLINIFYAIRFSFNLNLSTIMWIDPCGNVDNFVNIDKFHVICYNIQRRLTWTK